MLPMYNIRRVSQSSASRLLRRVSLRRRNSIAALQFEMVTPCAVHLPPSDGEDTMEYDVIFADSKTWSEKSTAILVGIKRGSLSDGSITDSICRNGGKTSLPHYLALTTCIKNRAA